MSVTEEELKAKATAPRITLEDMKATQKIVDYYIHPTTCLTICIITLQNGFTVTGESACAYPENFNKDIGERISYENAEKKIWALLGYGLKEQQYQATRPVKERVTRERDSLNENLNKLTGFINTLKFKDLPFEARELLHDQEAHMRNYANTLNKRIDLME